MNKIRSWYCRVSSLVVGTVLVFIFLFGVRSFSFWDGRVPFPLLFTLGTAIGATVLMYYSLEFGRQFLWKRFFHHFSTCSTNLHQK